MVVHVPGGLIERALELEAVSAAVESGRAGVGGALLIEGQAGIGKTALVTAACERAERAGMTVLAARGDELEVDFAWGVVRQLFQPALRDADADERAALLAEAAGLAGPAFGQPVSAAPKAEVSFSTVHGLYWLVVNLAQRRPLLLAVDDLHWADRPSLRFVVYVVARVAGLPVCVLAAARPAGSVAVAGDDLVARLAVAPGVGVLRPAALSEAACAALVREQLSSAVDDAVCAACHEMTGGNPFLLRATIAELASDWPQSTHGLLARVGRLTPAVVSRSVLLRLAGMPAAALALARAVAVLGPRADLRRAGVLAGIDRDEAARALATLARAEILLDGVTLAFVHPLVRGAVYGDLSAAQRGRWHEAAARLLADEGVDVEELVPHLLASAANADSWTVERLRDAGARARSRAAPEIAIDCLKRALAEPPTAQQRPDVLVELGVAEALAAPEASRGHLATALALVPDQPRRARVTLALGQAIVFTGEFAAAADVLERGIAELDGGDPQLTASLEAEFLNAARFDLATRPRMHALLERLSARAARGERLDPRLHANLATEIAAAGRDLPASVAHANLALADPELIAGSRPETWPIATITVPHATTSLLFAGEPQRAHRYLTEWLDTARQRGWRLIASLALAMRAAVNYQLSAVSESVADGYEALTACGETWIAPFALAHLIEALAERGEFDAAEHELQRHGLNQELARTWPLVVLRLHRGRLRCAHGDHRTGLPDILEHIELADAWGVHNPAMLPGRSSAALALVALGDPIQARKLADEELARAQRWGAPRAIGVALRAAAIAHGGAIEQLQDAVTTLARAAAPLEHARALTDLGAVQRRTHNPAEARRTLRHALDLAHEHGGLATADRARTELTIAGARPRRDALRGRDALTPSELRTAQLASQGNTNRQIAQTLFVTLRTVELHLTNSYTKLNITSRRELEHALHAHRSPATTTHDQ